MIKSAAPEQLAELPDDNALLPSDNALLLSRRAVLKQIAGSTVALGVVGSLAACSSIQPNAAVTSASATNSATSALASQLPLKGRIRHSVARWTYSHLSLPELCQLVQSLGFSAIDLVGPAEWPILKQYGIDCAMCNGAELNLVDGWCERKNHPELIKRYLQHIDLVADAGYKNLICFAGNARGMDKETALTNAVSGLQQVLGKAQARGVVLQMELFNSKVDHPDYLADSSAFGIELCQRLQSEHFKLLFDIYHMQIMEGDIISTIRKHHQYFGHYHTAGVPGRHEIDDSQELNYPAIAKAILATSYRGYLAQEFMPTPATVDGKAQSLAAAIQICDV
ncbi:MAG: TIM barrel protein [Rheinheimera sp.]|nr:TIM barrel protein [Rheinheimera sp.]